MVMMDSALVATRKRKGVPAWGRGKRQSRVVQMGKGLGYKFRQRSMVILTKGGVVLLLVLVVISSWCTVLYLEILNSTPAANYDQNKQ